MWPTKSIVKVWHVQFLFVMSTSSVNAKFSDFQFFSGTDSKLETQFAFIDFSRRVREFFWIDVGK